MFVMTMFDSGVIFLLSCWIMFEQVISMYFDVQCYLQARCRGEELSVVQFLFCGNSYLT